MPNGGMVLCKVEKSNVINITEQNTRRPSEENCGLLQQYWTGNLINDTGYVCGGVLEGTSHLFYCCLYIEVNKR
jgi:hypothetical protein